MRRWSAAVVLLCALLGAGLLDVLTARPASAHAVVVTTTPADGARLAHAPAEATVEFDEAVSLGAGYARVLDGDGNRVDTGEAAVRGRVLTVPLRAGLPEAGYVVTYRVVSADSHPVPGAFAFAVGDGTLVPADPVGDEERVDPGVAAVLPLARWAGYSGLALGLGVPLLLATCWPGGWVASPLRRLSLAGLAAVVVGGGLSLLVQGPHAAAAGLGSLLDVQLLGSTVDSAYGRTLLARVAVAVLLAAVLALGWRRGRRPSTAVLAAAGVLAAGLVVLVAAVGHPVAGPLPALAVAVSTVHVAAMSAWLGGLAALLAGALRTGTSSGELDGLLPRWSGLAAAYVGALVVTGVLQSVREVGSLSALVGTGYGRVLLAKLAVVALVLVAAAVSRDWVQQRTGGRRRPGRRGGRRPSRRVVAQAFAAGGSAEPPVAVGVLRRSVLVELAGAVVVLGLSAVLVSQYPARAAEAAAPVDVSLPLHSASGTAGTGTVHVSLDPAGPGPTMLHLALHDEQGRLTQPRQITVALTEVAQEIGPLDVELAAAGPGRYTAEPVLPAAGTWTLTVTVRLDEFTAVTAGTAFPVR